MAFIKRGITDITGVITAEQLEADKERLKKLETENVKKDKEDKK